MIFVSESHGTEEQNLLGDEFGSEQNATHLPTSMTEAKLLWAFGGTMNFPLEPRGSSLPESVGCPQIIRHSTFNNSVSSEEHGESQFVSHKKS
jgi:hypothetical protein